MKKRSRRATGQTDGAPVEERDVTSQVGPLVVDWPRSIGFFGAVGLGIALDLVPLPVGLFIGAVPFIKLFNNRAQETPVRFWSQMLEGAAKPVGGDSEGTIRLKSR